jgi:PEGA domain
MKEGLNMNCKHSLTMGVAVVLLVPILCGNAIAAQNASEASLADQVKTLYKLAKMARDSSGWSVVEAGTVLVIQKGGILGVPPANAAMAPATYKDGDLHPPGGFATAFVGHNTRQLAVGEKVYITKIDVKPTNDKVMLTIIECDSCNGVQEPSSYKSAVVFQFPKGYLDKADASQVRDVISQVLAVDTGANDQQQTTTQQQPAVSTAPESAANQPQTNASSEIEVTSTPSGADIELDGSFMGNTPSTIDVPPGDHTIAIKKNGYKPWERKIKVGSRKVNISAELEAAPKAKPGPN